MTVWQKHYVQGRILLEWNYSRWERPGSSESTISIPRHNFSSQSAAILLPHSTPAIQRHAILLPTLPSPSQPMHSNPRQINNRISLSSVRSIDRHILRCIVRTFSVSALEFALTPNCRQSLSNDSTFRTSLCSPLRPLRLHADSQNRIPRIPFAQLYFAVEIDNLTHFVLSRGACSLYDQDCRLLSRSHRRGERRKIKMH